MFRLQDFPKYYEQGKHERIWTELVALGPLVREPPYDAIAQEVARLMMIRIRNNLTLVTQRLQQLGYRFEQHYQGWFAPSAELRQQIDTIEYTYGVLPITLRAWFDQIGQVDLAGHHPVLNHRYRGSHIGTTEPYGDALEVTLLPDSISSLFSALPTEGYTQQIRAIPTSEHAALSFETTTTRKIQSPFKFEFATDVYNKAGYSGGGEYRMTIPAPGFDAPIFAYPPWTGMFFIPYLRTCFRWGGFPGLSRDPQALYNARDELAFLTKDLLPI